MNSASAMERASSTARPSPQNSRASQGSSQGRWGFDRSKRQPQGNGNGDSHNPTPPDCSATVGSNVGTFDLNEVLEEDTVNQDQYEASNEGESNLTLGLSLGYGDGRAHSCPSNRGAQHDPLSSSTSLPTTHYPTTRTPSYTVPFLPNLPRHPTATPSDPPTLPCHPTATPTNGNPPLPTIKPHPTSAAIYVVPSMTTYPARAPSHATLPLTYSTPLRYPHPIPYNPAMPPSQATFPLTYSTPWPETHPIPFSRSCAVTRAQPQMTLNEPHPFTEQRRLSQSLYPNPGFKPLHKHHSMHPPQTADPHLTPHNQSHVVIVAQPTSVESARRDTLTISSR